MGRRTSQSRMFFASTVSSSSSPWICRGVWTLSLLVGFGMFYSVLYIHQIIANRSITCWKSAIRSASISA
jgi:hypothetical protein